MSRVLNAVLGQLAARQDLIFLAFIFVFVLMFIVPVPPGMIDVLITLNIALTLIVLIASTYLRGPTDLSTFPAIILFTTVFRLAITVASARLILSYADAGEVIKTFGTFIVGGKLLVGLVVFLIVAIVQFIVVVKGAERIAEVGARFTLDALPGKQMSIDSDLRNGDITKEEARHRRAILEKESQFFGAMDGAMRFVKGDAIAGFVVIFVNLLGGILVGMATRGMGFSEASRTYSLLTVGEGLVSQIPAMLVAIAAGIVATRVAREDSSGLGADIASELAANKRSLVIAGAVLLMLGFMPGFPTMIFAAIAGVLIIAAFLLSPEWAFWRRKEQPADEGETQGEDVPFVDQSEPPPSWAPAEIGDIYQIAAPSAVAEALELAGVLPAWQQRCDAMDRDFGFRVARASLRIDDALPADSYRLDVEDVPVFHGHWRPELRTVLAARQEAEQLGLARSWSDHPVLGPIAEVDAGALPANAPAERTMDAAQRFILEMEYSIRANAAASFGFAEASAWLDQLAPKYPQLVAQIQQNVPTLRLVEICRRLLDEGVSLSPPRALLEALLRSHDGKQDVTTTVEAVRKLLRRQIIYSITRGAPAIPAILLDPNAESRLIAMSRMGAADLEGQKTSGDLSGLTFARVVGSAANDARTQATAPVLVTTSKVRAIAQAMLKRHGVQIPVISLDEIGNDTQVRPLRALTVAELGLA